MSTLKTDAITAVTTNGDLSLDGLGTGGVSVASTLKMTKGGDIASASPLVIDTDGNYFDVTGTTSFSAMTVESGNYFMLQFDGALTITHGSGIELPGAANLTTAAGDRLICYATAANTVEVMNVATEAAAAGGGLASLQTFTASGTWTKPAGLARVVVWTVGGGGGGGGASAGSRVGSGGGGGGLAIELLETGALGGTETVTIGAGGTAGATGGQGGSGGTSSFGSLNSATGGVGGKHNGGDSGIGGVGSGGNINAFGDAGAFGAEVANVGGGAGGGSFIGGGGFSKSAGAAGQVGNLYGGGASGGRNTNIGGVGAAGIVIVWEYN